MGQLKHKNINHSLSHRITINCKSKLYDNLIKLKAETHIKSLSKTIDILLKDELNTRTPINQKTLNNIRQNLPKLCEKMGQLNRNIVGVCDNLNQIAYDLNVKKYQGKKINPADFIMQNGLKIRQDIQIIEKYKNNFKDIRKEMNQIWQLLM